MAPAPALQLHPIPGFLITQVRYDPHFYQPWHLHEETRLIVTIRGGFSESWARREHACGPATALLRPAGEMHTNRYDARGAVCVNVRISPDWALRPPCYGIASASNGRLYRELQAGDSASTIAIQCAVLEIMAPFFRLPTSSTVRRPPRWIESTKELLRSRLSSPPDLFETARIAGVHPAHLSRAFRQFTGTTLGAYVRRQRIESACAQLRQSPNSLADIAAATGFYDQAHFSRIFRRHLGISPKEFRALHQS